MDRLREGTSRGGRTIRHKMVFMSVLCGTPVRCRPPIRRPGAIPAASLLASRSPIAALTGGYWTVRISFARYYFMLRYMGHLSVGAAGSISPHLGWVPRVSRISPTASTSSGVDHLQLIVLG